MNTGEVGGDLSRLWEAEFLSGVTASGGGGCYEIVDEGIHAFETCRGADRPQARMRSWSKHEEDCLFSGGEGNLKSRSGWEGCEMQTSFFCGGGHLVEEVGQGFHFSAPRAVVG